MECSVRLVVLMLTSALMADSILNTIIIPILPYYLYLTPKAEEVDTAVSLVEIGVLFGYVARLCARACLCVLRCVPRNT